jgi:hypothetical protein
MDALVAYGSGSEESDDNGEQQQEQKQASSHEEGGNSGEIPGFFTYKDKPITD